MKKFSHCHFCGSRYESESWPRVCLNENCKQMHWSNPLPVVVLLVPVIREVQSFPTGHEETGILLVRRSIPPHIGQLALPGGFIVTGETWQQGAARELFEETGIEVKPGDIEHSVTLSDETNHLLIFCYTPSIDATELDCFHTNEEVSELIVASKHVELCFPMHSEQLRKYFGK